MKRATIGPVLFLLLLSFAAAEERVPGETSEVLRFCQDTREYCENKLVSFAEETDRQIKLREEEFLRDVKGSLTRAKFGLGAALFGVLVAAFSLLDYLKSRRMARLWASAGQPPPIAGSGVGGRQRLYKYFFFFSLLVNLFLAGVVVVAWYG